MPSIRSLVQPQGRERNDFCHDRAPHAVLYQFRWQFSQFPPKSKLNPSWLPDLWLAGSVVE
jgi:hypothetical protein